MSTKSTNGSVPPGCGREEGGQSESPPGRKREPQRRCVACSAFRGKADMIRLAEIGGKTLIWEGRAVKAPSGKGVYLCRSGQCIGRFFSDRRLKKRYVSLMGEDARRSLERILNDLCGQEKGESCCS